MSAVATNWVQTFAADVDRFESALNGRLDELTRNLGFAAAEALIVGNKYSPGTPVDTGFARNSWAVGLNAEPDFPQAPAPPTDTKGEPVSVSSPETTHAVIAEATAQDLVFIESNCVYMEALEFGHSGQAPQGMVRLTAQALPQIARDIVREMSR